MSNYFAIESVSRSLKNLLTDRLQDPVDVTIAPPDVILPGSNGKRVNLYLYRLSENGFLKNQEVPGKGYPGAYGHPPLSLDLFYLITSFGESNDSPYADFQAQRILGDVMRVLHDYPIITDSLKFTRTTPSANIGDPILDTHLIGEFEQIKVTLQPMSLEDLSKLWAALPDTNFRRSVAYQVSVIQIESRIGRRYPKPVGELPLEGPRVFVAPFSSPYIHEIRVIRKDDLAKKERQVPYARIGDKLVLIGWNFGGQTTRVTIGSVSLQVSVSDLKDDRIEVTIPDNPNLQPGPQAVRVIKDVIVRAPPDPSAGYESNASVFMLVPEITALDKVTSPGSLIVQGKRLHNADLECLTLLDSKVIQSKDYTGSSPTEIKFSIVGMASGTYAVRVRVNGAESFDDEKLNLP
ncbi:MAG: DUF4255 domain-containing protein [Anaerolineales bacterium]|nr:DUF4255 domain-containing protein [Anaerolineales bacterium]